MSLATNVENSDFIMIDNTIETKKTTVGSLSSCFATKNELQTTQRVNTLDLGNILIGSNYTLSLSDLGKMLMYSKTSPITAFVTSAINTIGYNTMITQLSSGSVTIALSSNYTSGGLISYGNLFTTAGVGAIASIARVSDNNFLISGILQ